MVLFIRNDVRFKVGHQRAVVSARWSTFQLSVTLKIRTVSLLQRIHVQSFTSEPRKAWGVGLKSALICFWSSLTIGSACALGQQFYASLLCCLLLLNSRIIKYLFANLNVKKYNQPKHICPGVSIWTFRKVLVHSPVFSGIFGTQDFDIVEVCNILFPPFLPAGISYWSLFPMSKPDLIKILISAIAAYI